MPWSPNPTIPAPPTSGQWSVNPTVPTSSPSGKWHAVIGLDAALAVTAARSCTLGYPPTGLPSSPTPNQEELWAYPGWWIVLWSNGNIEFYNDADYRAKFTLPEGMQ